MTNFDRMSNEPVVLTEEQWQRVQDIQRRADTKPRCGPWDERDDGCFVCRRCGEVDAPSSGPFGI